MATIAPLQAFGLGDVIFCQTLANEWIAQGHDVIWGVEPHLIEGLNLAYPNVKFTDWRTLGINYNDRTFREENGYQVIPLRWNVERMKVPYSRCMETKYTMFDKDWRTWRDGAMWQRDEIKENELIRLLDASGEYAVVNTTYGTDMSRKIPKPVLKMPVIEMKYIHGFSLFDWAKVLGNAAYIHTVSTSIIYILEMLSLQAREIHLYKREPIEKNHDNYSYILERHKYILH